MSCCLHLFASLSFCSFLPPCPRIECTHLLEVKSDETLSLPVPCCIDHFVSQFFNRKRLPSLKLNNSTQVELLSSICVLFMWSNEHYRWPHLTLFSCSLVYIYFVPLYSPRWNANSNWNVNFHLVFFSIFLFFFFISLPSSVSVFVWERSQRHVSPKHASPDCRAACSNLQSVGKQIVISQTKTQKK